jgi:hypothetical protein
MGWEVSGPWPNRTSIPRPCCARSFCEMCAELIKAMTGNGIKSGTPMPPPNINAAIEAVEGIPVGVKPVTRSALTDDGEVPGLTLYAEAGAIARLKLDPVRAVAFASKLIKAAPPRVRST